MSTNGYNQIEIKGKPTYEHRMIMEQHLGRPLTSGEVVHHVNGNRKDNRIENLQVVISHAIHMRDYHPTVRPTPHQTKEIVQQIMLHLNSPFGTYNKCFCGNIVHARNLCTQHYGWVAKWQLHKKSTTPKKGHVTVPQIVIDAIIHNLMCPINAIDCCFCGHIIYARNLCHTHYEYARRHKLF